MLLLASIKCLCISIRLNMVIYQSAWCKKYSGLRYGPLPTTRHSHKSGTWKQVHIISVKNFLEGEQFKIQAKF